MHGVDVIEPIHIEALTALFSGKFAPAQARLEEVSRLSSQAIGDTYFALAYYLHGQRRPRTNHARTSPLPAGVSDLLGYVRMRRDAALAAVNRSRPPVGRGVTDQTRVGPAPEAEGFAARSAEREGSEGPPLPLRRDQNSASWD